MREVAPTGQDSATSPVTGGARKPAVDLPGQLTAQGGGERPEQPGELSEEEKQIVAKLRARDAEVHRHEQAHAAAGGQYAGTPSYTYQQGPDGKRYAIGGQTPIDASPIPGDPEATARKMEQVRRAALAPGSPSGADLAIAAAATSAAAQARVEAGRVRREEQQSGGESAPPAPAANGGAPASGGDQGSAPAPASAPASPPPAAQIGAYLKANSSVACIGLGTVTCSCTTCLPSAIGSSIAF